MHEPTSTGKEAYSPKGKRKGDFKGGKGKGKGECWNCGEAGHRAYECKNPTKKGKGEGKGYGQEDWRQRWQPGGVRSICGLTEAKTKTDEEGFAEAKPEKAAKTIRRTPARKTSMSDCRPVLTAKSGAFECLQEERDDAEEEQPLVFHSE